MLFCLRHKRTGLLLTATGQRTRLYKFKLARYPNERPWTSDSFEEAAVAAQYFVPENWSLPINPDRPINTFADGTVEVVVIPTKENQP